jgi:hypothetical protein
MPNKWTFRIPPIRDLVTRYVGDGKGWLDPFAGMSSPAEFTNDLNPEMPAKYHLEAIDFIKQLQGQFKGILFDPPYSYRQVTECYQSLGLKASAMDTSSNFTSRVKDVGSGKIMAGGLSISFGWNSEGFGKERRFEIIEILLVAHGSSHNDTIVTVERKLMSSLL